MSKVSKIRGGGANLPDPDVLAAESVEDLRAALEEFELIYADLAPETVAN